MSHNGRKLICRAPYIRNHTSYQLWYTSVKWWYLQAYCFDLVFQILIFKVFREVEGQKMVQNDKKLWLSCWYLKNHTLWLWFMVHVCKMIISPGIFLIFQNFDFAGFLRLVGGQRMTKNHQIQSVTLCISGTVDHINILVHRFKKMISSSDFFFFFFKYKIVNINIPTVLIGPLQQFF